MCTSFIDQTFSARFTLKTANIYSIDETKFSHLIFTKLQPAGEFFISSVFRVVAGTFVTVAGWLAACCTLTRELLNSSLQQQLAKDARQHTYSNSHWHARTRTHARTLQ